MRRLCLIAILSLLCLSVKAEQFDFSNIKSHPRIILKDGDIESLQKIIETDKPIRYLHNTVAELADKSLTKEVCTRQKKGKRLLHVSREVLERVASCSYMYLMTGKDKYARRAIDEMLAASRFTDWNPSHFLDVGEMTAALAIGYDWLYDILDEPTRKEIEKAILIHGLLEAKDPKKVTFYNRENNWNQVCNGGLVMGATAIYELCPKYAQELIHRAVASIPAINKNYAPSGVYPEGYDYWDYGTTYSVLLIETLRTAFGWDGGLSKAPGFRESAYFMNYMLTPGGYTFNFSDCPNLKNTCEPVLYWFALENNDPNLVYLDRKVCNGAMKPRIGSRRVLPVSLLFAARCNPSAAKPLEEDTFIGKGIQPLVIFRSSWDDPQATYLAIKGGSSSISHAHMDAGEFVWESLGERWSVDLGSQNYYSLESKGVKIWTKSQESDRWNVFRIGERSHSTLTVNEKHHIYKGYAPLNVTESSDRVLSTDIDLTNTLFDVKHAERNIILDKSTGILTTTDYITASEEPCLARWTINTQCKITITRRNQAILHGKKNKLFIDVQAPKKVKIFEESNKPINSYDAENKGTSRLIIEWYIKPGKTSAIKVVMTPQIN